MEFRTKADAEARWPRQFLSNRKIFKSLVITRSVLTLIMSSPVFAAQPATDYANPTTVAESNIWKTVFPDQDLSNSACCDNTTNVRGRFLASIITNLSIPHEGLIISGDSIEDELDLKNMDITTAVTFTNCTFSKGVDLSSAHFKRNLAFLNCEFKGATTFNDLKAEADLMFDKSTFLAKADFTHAQVGADLEINGAWFDDVADFQGLNVGHTASLDSIDLANGFPLPDDAKSVSLRALVISNLALSESAKLIHFRSNGPICVLDTLLHQAYSLWPSNRDVATWATNVKLGELETDYPNMPNAPKGIKILRATYFNSNVNISGGSVAKQLKAYAAWFHGAASFDSLRVDDSANMDYSIFDTNFSWGFAGVNNDLSLKNTFFRDTTTNANFFRLRSGRAIFQDAIFLGGLNLSKAVITGDLLASNTAYTNVGSDFSAMKVNGSAQFESSAFAAPVAFRLDQIDEDLDVTGVQFWTNADFRFGKVSGAVRLAGAQVTNATRTDRTNQILLEGLSYNRIIGFSDENDFECSWGFLKCFATNCPYSDGVYSNLESHFLRAGQSEIADRVHLEAKYQQRNQIGAAKPKVNWFLQEIGVGATAWAAFWWNFVPVAVCVLLWMFVPNLKLKWFWFYFAALVPRCLLHRVVGASATDAVLSSLTFPAWMGIFFLIRVVVEKQCYKSFAIILLPVILFILYSWKWLLSWVVFFTIGFGRLPVLAALWSVLIILVGLKKFEKMKQIDGTKSPSDWETSKLSLGNAFFYTVDHFFPIIDLKTDERWEPETDEIRWVGYGYRVLGFILIPIWAAALAGLIN